MFIFAPGDHNEAGTYHLEMHDGAPRAYLHCPLCKGPIPILHPIDADGTVKPPPRPVPVYLADRVAEQGDAASRVPQLVRCEHDRCNWADDVQLKDWRA